MISALLLLSSRGDILIKRSYRDDVDAKGIASAFKAQVIDGKLSDRCPIRTIGSISFLFIQIKGMYFVAVTRKNINASMVFQFLYQLTEIFRAYFDGILSEEKLKENFTLIYEILDEILDFGYPQNCEPKILQTFITTKKTLKELKHKEITEIMKGVTGAVNWRKPGIKYRKNEVYIDVIENVNMLMSSQGKILNSDVTGKIVMKAFLTGMPECKFGLNDKLMMQAENKKAKGNRYKEINIDDVTFHQCVQLGKFDSYRTISFIPLNGKFDLMKYRITSSVMPPFKIISPIVREIGKTRLEVEVGLKSIFNSRLFGKNVMCKIPLPKNTAKCKIHTTGGKGKYDPSANCIKWVIKRFPGSTLLKISADVELISLTSINKKWSKPPISLNFTVPMFTASGLHVRFLKVIEKKHRYQTIKWVRYITQAGNYEIRI